MPALHMTLQTLLQVLTKFDHLRKWLERVWIETDDRTEVKVVHAESLTRAELNRVVDFIDRDGDGVDLIEVTCVDSSMSWSITYQMDSDAHLHTHSLFSAGQSIPSHQSQ